MQAVFSVAQERMYGVLRAWSVHCLARRVRAHPKIRTLDLSLSSFCTPRQVRAGCIESLFTRVCFNFIHFNTLSRNQDIWPPSMRVWLLLPFARACYFDIRSTAQHQQHLGPAQKEKWDLVVHVRSTMYRESSTKVWNGTLHGKQSRSDVHDSSTRKRRYCNRPQITPQRMYLHYGFNKIQNKQCPV